MIGIDFAKVANPDHTPLLTELADIIEITTNAIASESNIPQIPERITVNGDSNQNRRTHIDLPVGSLADT